MMLIRKIFGFHLIPFTREMRPQDYFSLGFYDEALDAVVHTVENRQSAVVLAPAGAGKTAFLRRLKDRLPEVRYDVRYIKVINLSKRDLCREIAVCVGAKSSGSYPALVRNLQDRFLDHADVQGRRPVLLIDEAHDLRPEALAMLRILTNFDMDSRLVLSFVLAGQPSLRTLLLRDDQEAIARRIAHYATLRLLSRDELASYLAHRATCAGAKTFPFDDAAVEAIYELSRGNLRAADNLALKSLERAALAEHRTVSTTHVTSARKDLWP